MDSAPLSEEDNKEKTRRSSVDTNMKVSRPDGAQPLTVPDSQHVSPIVNGEDSFLENRPKLRLLDLPFEILSPIAMELSGGTAMTSFSLVNRNLHGVAQIAMAKRLLIHPGRIKMVIAWLTRHPHLMSSVNSVSLGAYQPEDTEQVNFSHDSFEPGVVDILHELIPKTSSGTVTWDALWESRSTPYDLWNTNSGMFLAILFSLCPNINNITIQPPSARHMVEMPERVFPNLPESIKPLRNMLCTPASLLPAVILAKMRNNLTSITLAQSLTWAGLAQVDIMHTAHDVRFMAGGKRLLTFAGFRKLKHLDIPMDVLGHPQTVFFHHKDDEQLTKINLPAQCLAPGPWTHTLKQVPTKILPLSLQTLRLRSCNHRAFMLLQRVADVPVHKSQFTRIDLYFDTCARSSLTTCLHSHEHASDLLSILSQVEHMGIKVNVYTGKHEQLINIRAELARLQHLSDCDMAIVASAGKQFSDLDLDVAKRRGKSPQERCLFHRHGVTHFDLFNSSNFDSAIWQNVALFHGVENTRFDPEFLAKQRPAQTTNRVKAKCRRPRDLPSLDDFVFGLAIGPMFSEDRGENVEVLFLGEAVNIACPTLSWKEGTRKARPHNEELCTRKTEPIFFDCPGGERLVCGTSFEAALWCEVDWKCDLQPHVRSVRSRNKRAE
jgi:hypothetical protein